MKQDMAGAFGSHVPPEVRVLETAWVEGQRVQEFLVKVQEVTFRPLVLPAVASAPPAAVSELPWSVKAAPRDRTAALRMNVELETTIAVLQYQTKTAPPLATLEILDEPATLMARLEVNGVLRMRSELKAPAMAPP